MFGSFWLMLVGLNLSINFAIENSATDPVINSLTTFYQVGLWITIFTLGYMVIYWIAKLLLKFGTIGSKKKFNFISENEARR